MPNTVRVAAAQAAPIYLNKEKTVEKACEWIKQAGAEGVKLIVFPEAFISGYPDWIWLIPNSKGADLNKLYIDLVNSAVSVPDGSTERLCQAAREAGIHVIMGMNERNDEASGGSLFNSILYIDDQGRILGRHRKLIPTGGERLVWSQGDGSTLDVYETPFARISGLICWENYMPLARNAVYALGTQILATPTWDKSPNWTASLQHIAREGGLFVINCCMALRMKDIPDEYEFKKLYPEGREWVNPGHSCIINPKGEIIAGPAEAKEELLITDLDLSLITAAKRMFDVAGHYARPDVFYFGLNKKPNPNLNVLG